MIILFLLQNTVFIEPSNTYLCILSIFLSPFLLFSLCITICLCLCLCDCLSDTHTHTLLQTLIFFRYCSFSLYSEQRPTFVILVLVTNICILDVIMEIYRRFRFSHGEEEIVLQDLFVVTEVL